MYHGLHAVRLTIITFYMQFNCSALQEHTAKLLRLLLKFGWQLNPLFLYNKVNKLQTTVTEKHYILSGYLLKLPSMDQK